jgi:hypothetical protein
LALLAGPTINHLEAIHQFPNPLLTEECYWVLFYKISFTLPTICWMYYYILQINWVSLTHTQKKEAYISILATFTISSVFLAEVNTKEKSLFLTLFGSPYLYCCHTFSMVPNNHFYRGRDPVYIQFCVCDMLTQGTG